MHPPYSREARFSARALERYAAAALPERLAIRAADDGVTEILIYDEIGWYGIMAKDFVLALAEAGDGPLNVRINSPGGDVFEGMAIYNALVARTALVTVTVDGLAASAASVIAMAGKMIRMPDSAMMMIHNCWSFCIGNRIDMRAMADMMEKIDGQMAGIYAARANQDKPACQAMMDAETWFTGQEALEAGLCDELIQPPAQDQSQAAAKDLPRAGLDSASRPRALSPAAPPAAAPPTAPRAEESEDGCDVEAARSLCQAAQANIDAALVALGPTDPPEPAEPIDPAAAANAEAMAQAKARARAKLRLAEAQ